MDLPRSTRALLEAARRIVPAAAAIEPLQPGDCLDIASASAAVARALHCTYLHDHWGACLAARAAGAAPVLHADQLPTVQYRHIFLEAAELDPALARQLAAQAADRLGPDGLLITTAREADVAPWFAAVSTEEDLLVARQPIAGQYAPESFTYELALGGQQLVIQSEPGIFSPRGLDPGTREMLQIIRAEPGQRFLDLGCGAGVVSLAASQVWGCQVTAVDVSARALRLTRQNAPAAEVLASDGFSALRGRTFDLIASNPPYHTDFAVAKGFIEGAYRHLAPGGWLYLVVKRADWYVRKMRAVFGGCRVVEREGYVIISAERRALEGRPSARPAPAMQSTTRKHAKRMAASGHHRPQR